MSTSAPMTRTVDQMTGDGLEGAEQLRAEVTSLKAERSELYRQLEQALEAAARADEYRHERDDLASDVFDLREANQTLMQENSRLKTDLARVTEERNTWRASGDRRGW